MTHDVEHRSREPGRSPARRRVLVGITCAVIALGLLGLPRLGADRAVRRAEAELDASARLGDAASGGARTPGAWSRRRLPERAAPRPQLAMIASEARESSDPPPAAAIAAIAFDPRERAELGLWFQAIRLARSDADVQVPEGVESILSKREAELDAASASIASQAAADGGALDDDDAGFLRMFLLADAVRQAVLGQPMQCQSRLDAALWLLQEGHPFMTTSESSILRVARPADPDPWIDVLDLQPGHETMIGWMQGASRKLLEPTRQPEIASPTLATLRDDLPTGLRILADEIYFLPATRARRAENASNILRLQAEIASLDTCVLRAVLPDGTTLWGPESGTPVLTATLLDDIWVQRAADWVMNEADVLVTREILRQSAPASAHVLRQPTCSDWRIAVETDTNSGIVRVRAAGAIEGLSPLVRQAPAYDLSVR